MISWSDYYPFGLTKGGRSNESGSYRFGFQGQERDDEIAGEGVSWSYKFRMHNAKYARFFSVDPLTAKYPHNSPFAFSENRVIDGVELEGLEVMQVGGTFTISAGRSYAKEKGYIFDLSGDKVAIFDYTTTYEGIETNLSISAEIGITFFPTMPSYKYVAGDGTIKGFAAGEMLYGSTGMSYSGGYIGNSLFIGVGLGLLPASISTYDSFTEIGSPINNAAEMKHLSHYISESIDKISNQLESVNQNIRRLNSGISLTTDNIRLIDRKIESAQNDGKDFSEYSDLIIDRRMYMEARESYRNEKNQELEKSEGIYNMLKGLYNAKEQLHEKP